MQQRAALLVRRIYLALVRDVVLSVVRNSSSELIFFLCLFSHTNLAHCETVNSDYHVEKPLREDYTQNSGVINLVTTFVEHRRRIFPRVPAAW